VIPEKQLAVTLIKSV